MAISKHYFPQETWGIHLIFLFNSHIKGHCTCLHQSFKGDSLSFMGYEYFSGSIILSIISCLIFSERFEKVPDIRSNVREITLVCYMHG